MMGDLAAHTQGWRAGGALLPGFQAHGPTVTIDKV